MGLFSSKSSSKSSTIDTTTGIDVGGDVGDNGTQQVVSGDLTINEQVPDSIVTIVQDLADITGQAISGTQQLATIQVQSSLDQQRQEIAPVLSGISNNIEKLTPIIVAGLLVVGGVMVFRK